MGDPSDGELDLLLSRGRVRGPAAERVRQGVLDAVAPRPRRSWRRPLALALPASVLVAAAALLLIRPHARDGERSKGTAAGQAVIVELACSGGRPDHCPPGARVTIALSGA